MRNCVFHRVERRGSYPDHMFLHAFFTPIAIVHARFSSLNALTQKTKKQNKKKTKKLIFHIYVIIRSRLEEKKCIQMVGQCW